MQRFKATEPAVRANPGFLPQAHYGPPDGRKSIVIPHRQTPVTGGRPAGGAVGPFGEQSRSAAKAAGEAADLTLLAMRTGTPRDPSAVL